ncbi:MAG: ATP-binding cassette domain-containing protein [Candidatus Hydrogenedentales bacterium]
MISIRGVHKRFGAKHVLQGVDLEIAPGETHVILGRSGEGKSVLLKIICGLLRPDAGTLELEGQSLLGADGHALQCEIQMLFQGGALFDSMSVAHNIAFYAVEHGAIRFDEAESFAAEYLEMVDLAEAARLTPAELSGGMRKRAALARALAAKPRIMLYDEPTTGLDPNTGQVINQLIRETQRRFGVTSVVVTHDLRSAREVGDRCSFLFEGRMLETTTPQALSKSPHALVREFAANAV